MVPLWLTLRNCHVVCDFSFSSLVKFKLKHLICRRRIRCDDFLTSLCPVDSRTSEIQGNPTVICLPSKWRPRASKSRDDRAELIVTSIHSDSVVCPGKISGVHSHLAKQRSRSACLTFRNSPERSSIFSFRKGTPTSRMVRRGTANNQYNDNR